MENKRTIQVQFARKVYYSAIISVTEEEFKILSEVDGEDIQMYGRNGDVKEAYVLLENYSGSHNEFDWNDEIEDFEITNEDVSNEF